MYLKKSEIVKRRAQTLQFEVDSKVNLYKNKKYIYIVYKIFLRK